MSQQVSEETIYRVLTRIGQALALTVDRTDIQNHTGSSEMSELDPLRGLEASAEHSGIFLRETDVNKAEEVIGFIQEDYPLILANPNGSFLVLEKLQGRSILAYAIGDKDEALLISRRKLQKLMDADAAMRFFVCRQGLECASVSLAPDHHGHHRHHVHLTPLRRFMGLMVLESTDLWRVLLFAFVSGILALATPLVIESLVNVVQWGTYIQPLIFLGLMLFVSLGIAGALKLLQTVVIELIQRRLFVRIVGDLSHRFPRASQADLVGRFPRELANRAFDVMTIQKAAAVLLMDGITVVLTTFLGLILLGFYHPFLLAFAIVMVLTMVSVTWVLGRGGIRTAIEESLTKYAVIHWLQDVISSPGVFKTDGGEALAVQRANQMTANYIQARQRQFRVVFRQVAFVIILQVIASSVLLALGGWLVINGGLTLGQLVASELVVTTVVSTFAKAGKSLETFYDLMAGLDKVGHLLDIETDARHELTDVPEGPAAVSWSDLHFHAAAMDSTVPAADIAAGSRVAIVGDDVDGRTLLSRTLAGLASPADGRAQIAGFDAAYAAASNANQMICYAGTNDLFHGTLRENIELGRTGVGQPKVREALELVGLTEAMLRLPDGLQTKLLTHGFPLTESQSRQVVLARAIVAEPKLLIVDCLLDGFAPDVRATIWKAISAKHAPWTLLLNTNREDIAELCDYQFQIRRP